MTAQNLSRDYNTMILSFSVGILLGRSPSKKVMHVHNVSLELGGVKMDFVWVSAVIYISVHDYLVSNSYLKNIKEPCFSDFLFF